MPRLIVVYQCPALAHTLSHLLSYTLPCPPAAQASARSYAAQIYANPDQFAGQYPCITDPTILVADEPTGDLDRVSAEEILTMMERLNSEMGKTIIMVTHDPRAAQRAKVLRHLDKGYLNNDDSQNPL